MKDMEFLRFKGIVGNEQWKWCTLMTNYTADGELKFLGVQEPNRWINSEISRMKEIE